MKLNYDEVEICIPSYQEPLLFRVGKTARGNFDAIDASEPDDIWFHVDGFPSGHVVLATSHLDLNKKQKQQAIVQGAVLCKRQSKKKSESQVRIVYTEIKHVRKMDVPGSVEIAEERYKTI